MAVTIQRFQSAHLSQAAGLLARRHRRDRANTPALPERFETARSAKLAIRTSLARPFARGYAASAGDEILAYLIGDMQIDAVWGRSGWIRTAGFAYASESQRELLRDLYAALGEFWVRQGVFTHFIQSPTAAADINETWYSLSFGIEHIYALADLETLAPTPPDLPAGVEIRQAGLEDREPVASMADLIWRTQVGPPVWAVQMPEQVARHREDWAATLDDPDITVWLAIDAGRVVAIQGHWPAEAAVSAAEDNLVIPENCAHMSLAATREEVRGRGYSTLLSQHLLAHTRDLGYRYCDTEWRSTNLLASRFWPRQGYRPVAYRLVRRIDERIAWASGEVPLNDSGQRIGTPSDDDG